MYSVQVLAEDGVLVSAGWPQGGYDVCWDCWRKVYPAALPLPKPQFRDHSSDNYICAVCWRYARENDEVITQRVIRLTAADILVFVRPEALNRDELAMIAADRRRVAPDKRMGIMLKRLAGMTPGVKRCCSECWYKVGPIVAARMQREIPRLASVPWNQIAMDLV